MSISYPPNTPLRAKRLLSSIHDVSPRHEAQVDRLYDHIIAATGQETMAMLVVPDYWGEAPLTPNSAFAAKLRRWTERGTEIFVHGWFHKDMAIYASGINQFKAKHLTAGEGEFLGLDRTEALRRMRDGRVLIEDIIGTSVAGFIAPAWLYSDGAKQALADADFVLAEDHMRVWSPRTGAMLARGPVITWASRSKARTASSLAFASAARLALPMLNNVRVAVHPGDTTKPAIMESITKTLRKFARSHAPSTYADLLG